MADDDDVRGATGVGDIFAPTGPRRSSFTPAPTDPESLEAAAAVFDDDEIAAAMAAELARFASGPIPIQRPAGTHPAWPVDDLDEPEPSEQPEPEAAPHAEVAPQPEAASPVAAPSTPASEPVVEPVAEIPAQAESVVQPPVSVQSAVPEPAPQPDAEPVSDSFDDQVYVLDEVEPEAAPVPPAESVAAPANEPPGWGTPPAPIAADPVVEHAVVEHEPVEPAEEAAPAPQDVAPAAESQPDVAPAPFAPTSSAPQGPPDWATPLFGQPTDEPSSFEPPSFAPASFEQPPAPLAAPAAAQSDPFAPSAPSFAPSNGPFPPPGDSPAEPPPSTFGPPSGFAQPLATSDAETLRALYTAAPAPTVPPADAPPPPGYPAPPAASAPAEAEPVAAEPVAAAEPAAPEPVSPEPGAPSGEPASSETLSAIEELQAHLDQRDREAREYAAWESSMTEVGTPEALAAVQDARAERHDLAAPPPPAEEPAAYLPPPAADFDSFLAPPAPQPAAYVAAPTEEPSAYQVPPVEPPQTYAAQQSFAAPAAEAAPPADAAPPVYAAPPVDAAPPADAMPPAPVAPPVEPAPAQFFAPPVDEPAPFFAPPPPPVDEPVSFSAPGQSSVFAPPPPVDEPYSSFAPPVDEVAATPAASENDPFDLYGAAIDAPPPPAEPSPFPGFAPPATDSPFDFSAPSDPHELTFEPAPIPDAPVFLEPAQPEAPPAPVASEPDDNGSPVHELPVLVEPPAPDGVADLWRAASQEPLIPAPAEPVPSPQADEIVAPPIWDVAPAQPSAQPSPFEPPAPAPEGAPFAAPAAAAPPPAPVGVAGGFDDLLSGSVVDPGPQQPPGSAWSTAEPPPVEPPPVDPAPAEPSTDAAPEERHPFGEGVERAEAIDPSSSIFGAPPAPLAVNSAAVATVPEYIVVEPDPFGATEDSDADAVVLSAPPISVTEKAGLEPTPLEQRVGKSARLFWLWFAANSSIAAVVFGTIIFALGVSLSQAVVATLAGVALSFIPLGLGTLAGKRSGQPTMVISRATFGVVGNILPALISLFSRMFWAAALLWVLGAGAADILVGAQLTDGFSEEQLTLVIMVIGFFLAVVIAYGGYGLISIVQLIVSVISALAILGFIVLTFQYVHFDVALRAPDGPWILVVAGAVLVFSFVGLAWANSGADVARYQRTGSSGAAATLWATFGAAVPSFVLIAYGALLAASNPKLATSIAANPLDSLGRLLPVWYPVPLLAATALSLVSGVVLSLYSGGFALQSAGVQLRRSLSTLLVGLLAMLIAVFIALTVTDFTALFRDFSTTVAVPVAAWVGIFGAEIMIRRRRYDAPSLLNRGGVYADARWGNLGALVVISVIGFGLLSATLPGLGWEGYLYSALGVPLDSQLATSDLGVLVALVLGLAFPAVFGIRAIRHQESAEMLPE